MGTVVLAGATSGSTTLTPVDAVTATITLPSATGTLALVSTGTWTPVIGGSGGTSGQTYGRQVGTYIKIDKLVTCFFQIDLTAKGTITSAVQLQGLPFTAQTSAGGTGTVTFGRFGTMNTVWVGLTGEVGSASTTADIYGRQAASANETSLATGDIANTTYWYGSVTYYSAA
jgi:hypothetical protein